MLKVDIFQACISNIVGESAKIIGSVLSLLFKPQGAVRLKHHYQTDVLLEILVNIGEPWRNTEDCEVGSSGVAQ